MAIATGGKKPKVKVIRHGGREYKRGPKMGHFDLDVYTTADLIERCGLSIETVIKDAKAGKLPGRNFTGRAGWRFAHSAVMWWLAGSPGTYDPLAWNVKIEEAAAS